MSDFVSVLRVEPHPANIRADLGDLTELADSIDAQGILQPIVVQPNPRKHGYYLILAGHRRYAAARLAGLDEVPISVRGAVGSAQAAVVMLVENCQRADLTAIDKAEAMGALRKQGWTAARIARETGVSDATVSYYLSLLDLDQTSREKIRTGELPVGQAVRAVREVRARRRRRAGTPKVGPVWEPDHLNGTHPLARKAAALCLAREHTSRRQIGKVACGQCWETAIRQDEQLACKVAANGSPTAGGGVKFVAP